MGRVLQDLPAIKCKNTKKYSHYVSQNPYLRMENMFFCTCEIKKRFSVVKKYIIDYFCAI